MKDSRTLAVAVDGDVPLTARHVRFLARKGFIRLQRTRQVRRAVGA